MRVPVVIVDEESAEEHWYLSWEKYNFRSFSCLLLYWGNSSCLRKRKLTAYLVSVQAAPRLTGEMRNQSCLIRSRSYSVVDYCLEVREKKPGWKDYGKEPR